MLSTLTRYNKAIAAAVIAVLAVINLATEFHFGLSEEAMGITLAILTPIVVFLLPNSARPLR